MAVRNCADIGENLKKIMIAMLNDQTLLKLIYYGVTNPLDQPDLTQEQIQNEVYNKLVRIVPKVTDKDSEKCVIVIKVDNADLLKSNTEFRSIKIGIGVYVPFTSWLIAGDNLRPFAILGRIQHLLNGKTVNGLGKLTGGDFELSLLTEAISCYDAEYSITNYD